MIVVNELFKQFRAAGEDIIAVNNLSFSVAAGEVYGLLGPNGAGKTTTMRMIVGLLKADSGYAEVGGYRSSTEPDAVKSQLGLVSANDGVYPWLSVREMLIFFADLYGVPHNVALPRMTQLADTFGLQKILERRCANLSTGQKQRVILARGLIHDPPVMLLDEPTRGLDVIGSKVVFDYIAQLREMNKAVIVCTHRLDEAQRLCDRFGLLHAGQLWREGTLGELRDSTGCESLVDMFLGFLDEQADNSVPAQYVPERLDQ